MALIFGTNVARGQGSLHAKNYLLSTAQLGATAFETRYEWLSEAKN